MLLHMSNVLPTIYIYQTMANMELWIVYMCFAMQNYNNEKYYKNCPESTALSLRLTHTIDFIHRQYTKSMSHCFACYICSSLRLPVKKMFIFRKKAFTYSNVMPIAYVYQAIDTLKQLIVKPQQQSCLHLFVHMEVKQGRMVNCVVLKLQLSIFQAVKQNHYYA